MYTDREVYCTLTGRSTVCSTLYILCTLAAEAHSTLAGGGILYTNCIGALDLKGKIGVGFLRKYS